MLSQPEETLAGTGDLKGVRIIVVLGHFILGGAERQALLLARHLFHDLGADLEVWGTGEPGRVSQLCTDHGIPWRTAPVPVPWSPRVVTRIRNLASFTRALRRARPDVILPFMFYPSLASGIVWRLAGARVCIWNQRCEGRDRAGRIAEKLGTLLTRQFVANSALGRDFLVDTLGVSPSAVNVIYNGVQLQPSQLDRAQWRKHLGVDDDTFLACMVANLHQFKDHETLLRAWRIVVNQMNAMKREAVLLLAGAFFATEKPLKSLAFDLKLDRSVQFLGGVKDISGLLGAVDLGVHSSVNEGVPNGVLECMAAGLAVTGTDYPGLREALGKEGYRFLAPAFDPRALASQIILLASNDELRSQAGAANRLRIDAEFPPVMMYQKMVSLIAEGLRFGKGRAIDRHGQAFNIHVSEKSS